MHQFSKRVFILLFTIIFSSILLSAQDDGRNIALEAAGISTSHVSAWEDLSAINNGITPNNSRDKTGGAYGNWDGSNERWHWVEYSWEEIFVLYQSDLYWWEDGGGIVIPFDTYQEYWDIQDNSWKVLPNAVGNGVERDKFNITTFDPVFTNRIRVHMVSAISTGILEWRVWGTSEEIPLLSTSEIDPPLSPGSTSNVTLTAINDEGDPIDGYTFKLKVDIFNSNPDTNEEYLVDGVPVSETVHGYELPPSGSDGKVIFTVSLPGLIDPGDGIRIQILYSSGLPFPNAEYSFVQPGATPSAANLVINEIMSSNASTINDENGDSEDWIEIYNFSDVPVNLYGVGLSDNYENPFKWVFPNMNIDPGQFLLIWASNKDRRNPFENLHTNFAISASGEEIILTAPDGTLIDEVAPTPIPTDISYGRYPDGGSDFYFFNTPTPGFENSIDFTRGVLENVTFSIEPGFYTQTVNLELSHNDAAATIYYTLDGSVPNTLSDSYTGPITINDRSDEENFISTIRTAGGSGAHGWALPRGKIPKSTTIRAIAIKPEFTASRIETGTWFIYDEGRSMHQLPVISIVTPFESFFANDIGIYVAGNSNNFRQEGPNWEREVSVEFFYDNFYYQDNAGVRIHGAGTRSLRQKSLRLYARNEYGNSRFNFQVFPDQPYESYNRLILRNSGNDFGNTMLRDATIQQLFKDLDFDIQAYQPAVVYINGEYWGIQNLRERYDQHYLERVYGVDPDNVDFLTNNRIVKEGSAQHFNTMMSYLTNNDLSVPEHYEYIKTQIDISNLIDYQAANIYLSNADWPGNNIDFWRVRTDYLPGAHSGHDGRWRWLMFDTDFGFSMPLSYNQGGHYTHNTLAFVTQVGGTQSWPNPEWSTLLMRRMLTNSEFKYNFINRFADLLNTLLLPENIITKIDYYSSVIAPEMPLHIYRWDAPSNFNTWQNNINVMMTFAANRPPHQRNHIRNYFNLGSDLDITLNVDNINHGFVRINTIDVLSSTPGIGNSPYPWTGKYFQGVPITIEAIPKPGFKFSHWSGISGNLSGNRTLNIYPSSNMSLMAHFTEEETGDVISYWFFGTDLPNDTPLESVMPSYRVHDGTLLFYNSSLEGYPFNPAHPEWRVGSMERRNSPTNINYHPEANQNILFEESNMRALQIKQPLESNGKKSEMIFFVPTTNYDNILFRFAAMNEGAASSMTIEYSINEEIEWIEASSITTVNNRSVSGFATLSDQFQLYQLDFTNISESADNPFLKLRITFEGPFINNSDGNRVTFNNISLHGNPLEIISELSVTAISSTGGSITPPGVTTVSRGDSHTFTVTASEGYYISEIKINDIPLSNVKGESSYNHTINAVLSNITISALFESGPLNDVLVFPNPTNGFTYLKFLEGIDGPVYISVLNTNGSTVIQKNLTSDDGEHIMLDLSLLDPGVYLVKVQFGNYTMNKRVILIR